MPECRKADCACGFLGTSCAQMAWGAAGARSKHILLGQVVDLAKPGAEVRYVGKVGASL